MAQLIDGKASAADVREKIKEEIDSIRQNPISKDFTPGLAIVQVGDRQDSGVYIKNKLRAAQQIGIDAKHVKLPSTTTQRELESEIDRLNADSSIHGVIVQLPLDSIEQIDGDSVIDRIESSKDVDGLTRLNAGRLARGEIQGTVVPCTPKGCLHLVANTGTPVKGKRVVIVGRSKIVGHPAFDLFLWHHATVTICHSRTVDLAEQCRQADILIVAIGQAKMIKGDWIKPGAIVIDCGINVLEGQGANGKNKLVGDVDFDQAKEIAGFITPVPGGVGPMTVAMLLKNTLEQAKKKMGIAENGVHA